jgi:hypothetical protein
VLEGLDLASKVDMNRTARSCSTTQGRPRLPDQPRALLAARARHRERRNSQYDGWVRRGHLVATPMAK